ncbi:Uncharacterised protein [Streptococcus pseudoporcinus]|uniref:Uncharacterized protein n=1 Tax=Streptococcus pseudoporcinus TaxID=361101 RepID=A0A4U9YDD3_9STRE|nr:Uncharacterised protein [Streptococcus pseudoporcinus]VUC71002.1 Uncharacterised protein [Streptococcus pseudoporcinus]VUD00596.1 Uncharacterised protein [Streptococcus pseudoporcinus]VUD00971.1 Uncharacterised protein [Streptococcus pseudoporcinus]
MNIIITKDCVLKAVKLADKLVKEELLDYIYNNYEVSEDTLLITNSDMGKGYTSRVFKEIKKVLKIKKS